jgi:hypothetical protein
MITQYTVEYNRGNSIIQINYEFQNNITFLKANITLFLRIFQNLAFQNSIKLSKTRKPINIVKATIVGHT